MSSAVCLLSADCLLGQILFPAACHVDNFLWKSEGRGRTELLPAVGSLRSFFQRRLKRDQSECPLSHMHTLHSECNVGPLRRPIIEYSAKKWRLGFSWILYFLNSLPPPLGQINHHFSFPFLLCLLLKICRNLRNLDRPPSALGPILKKCVFLEDTNWRLRKVT